MASVLLSCWCCFHCQGSRAGGDGVECGSHRGCTFTWSSLQAPSEYETSPDQLFYRIAHLNRGQQYMLWVAAVTSAGRGNISEKVTIEPAGKGMAGAASSRGDVHPASAVPCP